MLVFERKIGQTVYIGPTITVVVLGVQGDKVRLGIQAPREVPILREELGPWRPVAKKIPPAVPAD